MADQPQPELVLVRFAGPGADVGELTWGQRELWRQMQERQSWLPVGGILRLPPGTTIDDAVADLQFVMSRYPSLRTRLRFDPDGPKQVAAGSGEIGLEIVDAADGADPAEVGVEVWLRYYQRDYDFTSEWPVRMAVIRHRGVLSRRVWMMCHLVTDGTGGRVIVEELADRDGCRAGTAMPPLEQARWQASPSGQRQSERSLRHWEAILRRVPARRFPRWAERPSPRYWQVQLDSRAAHLAVRAISARTGVESPSVLLAVFAVALARVTGIHPVVTQLTVNNRFRPGLARTVSPIAQNGLCVIDIPDATIDEVVLGARRRALAAYKHAYYHPERRDELVARVSRERGEPVEIDCFFNDRRLKPRDETGPPPTPEQIRTALPDSRVEWTHKLDTVHFDGLNVHIEDVPDTLRIAMPADVHRVSPEIVERCLREVLAVTVAAALAPATRTRPAATAR